MLHLSKETWIFPCQNSLHGNNNQENETDQKNKAHLHQNHEEADL